MAGKPANDLDRRMGERLRDLRVGNRETQRNLAAVIGVSAAQLQKYEKGVNRMAAADLQDMASHLNVPVTAFYDEGSSQGEPRSAEPSEASDQVIDVLNEASRLIAFATTRVKEKDSAAPVVAPQPAQEVQIVKGRRAGSRKDESRPYRRARG